MASKMAPEDAFYDHITLGLIKTLSNIPRISHVYCEKRHPCEKTQVVTWEQRNSVYLPEDMKKFYLSTDGFLLQWTYEYAPNDLRRVGYIHIPHLLQITLLRDNFIPNFPTPTPSTSPTGFDVNIPPSSSSTDFPTSNQTSHTLVPMTPTFVPPKDIWGNLTPLITSKSKIFELNNVNDVAKVCLIYESCSTSSPKIYLLELATMKWIFLADTFSEYLRMAVAHLGLPYWELCFTSTGLPTWTEQLFMLLAPHLLEEHDPRSERIINPASEHPHNIIDVNVFRAKPKLTLKGLPSSKMK